MEHEFYVCSYLRKYLSSCKIDDAYFITKVNFECRLCKSTSDDLNDFNTITRCKRCIFPSIRSSIGETREIKKTRIMEITDEFEY